MKEKVISWFLTGRFLKFFMGIFLTVYTVDGFGQKHPSVLNHTSTANIIFGRVRDSVDERNTPFILVAILRLTDSALVQFTRTKPDGSFSFRDIPKGIYRILISDPYYNDYSAIVAVREDSLIDLGSVIMIHKADLLSSVIVIPKTPLERIRGDTLEFSVSNMELKPNSTVEDLLKHLPGIHIDQDGGITVNGQKVEHLLVDGEDLFGSDPSIVTRNFSADMIAKVQILEKKSNRSEFTGIDDGQRVRTVNLTLREDKKKGYFVKAEEGANTKGYYNSNGLFGSFKDGRQLAALGMAANDGTNGFAGGSDDNAGGLSLGGVLGDPLGGSAGSGIPELAGGGLHYADKWNANEDHLNGNYSYGHLLTHPYSTTLTEQILPDSIYSQTQNSNSVNSNEQHKFGGDYDFIPDSLSAFRFSWYGTSQDGHNQFTSNGSSYFNDTIVNSSVRTIYSLVHSHILATNLMYRIRNRGKKARTFAVVFDLDHADNSTSGYLYDINNFYRTNGNLLNVDSTDQRKVITTSNLVFNTSLNFTQQLRRDIILAASYGLSFNRSLSLQSTYNRGDGKYRDFIDSLSSNYKNDVLTQTITVNLQSTNRPLTYTIGGDVIRFYDQEMDLLRRSLLKYNYFTVTPRVNMRYNINKIRSISLDYFGSTQQPSVAQLQPIQNNNDPLHITLGNPNLRPGFSHHLSIGFRSIKPVNINIGIYYGMNTNEISTKTFTDSIGRQVSQPVNVNGSQNGGVFIGINPKLSNGIDLGFNSNLSFGRNLNYIGTVLSRNDNYNAGGGLSIGKFVPEKYSILLNSNFNYSYSRTSVNLGVITRYWTQNYSAELSYFPLNGLELNTKCYYTWRQKTTIFDKNNSTMLWNAYISKDMISNQLTIRWRINDILGQNVGINRSITANQVSEITSNMIGRYWMASAIYRFTKRQQSSYKDL